MKVLVVSNMYPDEKHPSYGIFVKRYIDELDKIGILHQESVMHQHDGKLSKLFGYITFYVGTYFKVLFGGYDCVYVHQASHSSPPVIAAAKIRKPQIYTNVHGCDVAPENASQEKMQKYTKSILKSSARVIVPSEYYKEYVEKKYAIGDSKIFIYPSAGIDKNVFYEKNAKQKAVAKEKYGLNGDHPIFGMAGRISEGKGWDTFVEAIDILKKENVKATFVIVGSGREDDKLNALIKVRHLSDAVVRIGLLPQNELCDFYNAIDYFVFPTRRESESLGLVAIEAMACGIPVIASDFAAPKYYIEDGINGYKFKVGDSRQLAEIIKSCCTTVDAKSYQRLHDGAIATAERYSTENIRVQLVTAMNL